MKVLNKFKMGMFAALLLCCLMVPAANAVDYNNALEDDNDDSGR